MLIYIEHLRFYLMPFIEKKVSHNEKCISFNHESIVRTNCEGACSVQVTLLASRHDMEQWDILYCYYVICATVQMQEAKYAAGN